MASRGEVYLTRRIKEVLRQHGFWVMKVHGSAFCSGYPDLLAIRGGRAMWLEVKYGDGRLTELQAVRLKEVRNAGCVAEVVRSVEDVLGAIRRFESE